MHTYIDRHSSHAKVILRLKFNPTVSYYKIHYAVFLGTHVILDETLLTAGQLNSNGCLNLQALSNVLKWQKVKYDFQYHVVEIPCDLVS